MLTGSPHGPNAPRSVMLSVSALAKRDGVSKPTVSDKVKRLRQQGLTVELDSQGRVAAVNSAEYDMLRSRFGDPSKAQAPIRPAPEALPPPIAQGESYQDALRVKTWHEAELRRLEIAKQHGELIEAREVADGYDRAADAIIEAVDTLDDIADDVAAAVAREGVRGVGGVLKKAKEILRRAMADALRDEAKKLRAGITKPGADTLQ